MRQWRVNLYYVTEMGDAHLLGCGTFWANTAEDAKECAMCCWWDPRLETSGCSPDCYVVPLTEKGE